MRTRRWAIGCALFLSAAALQAVDETPGAAYVYFMTKPKDGSQPLPWRWFKRANPLTFHVAQVAPEEIPLEEIPTIMQDAHDTWSDLPCGGVPKVNYGGPMNVKATTPPADTSVEADNVIVFVRSGAEWGALGHSMSELAITKVFADPVTGEIVDADMEINDAGFRFTTGDEPDKPGEVDFVGTMIHESGHFLGLDHSLDPTATMYVSYIAATPTEAHPQRSLEQDDIDGICNLYKDVPNHVAFQPHTTSPGNCAGAGDAATILTLVTSIGLMVRRRSRARG